MAEIDISDDLNDFSDDLEIETVSGDKIPLQKGLNDSTEGKIENSGAASSSTEARRRLEALFEERALKTTICDDLYNPENKLD